MYRLVKAFYHFQIWQKWEDGKCYLRVVIEGNDPNLRKNWLMGITVTEEEERQNAIRGLTNVALCGHLTRCWSTPVHS